MDYIECVSGIKNNLLFEFRRPSELLFSSMEKSNDKIKNPYLYTEKDFRFSMSDFRFQIFFNELSTFNFQSRSPNIRREHGMSLMLHFQLNCKDHLGNNRLSYTLDPATNQIKILEENHYYPFGLKHGAYNQTRKGIKYKEQLPTKKEVKQVMPEEVKFKYYYQEQERQDELGLNRDSFKYRNYDYAIGRFMSVDPLAEKYPYNSTYAFQENKMGLGRELEGLELEARNENTGEVIFGPLDLDNNQNLTEVKITDEGWSEDLPAVEITAKGSNQSDMPQIIQAPDEPYSDTKDSGSNFMDGKFSFYTNLAGETTKASIMLYSYNRYSEGLRFSMASGKNYQLTGRNLSLFRNYGKPTASTLPRFPALKGFGKMVGPVGFFAGLAYDYKGMENYELGLEGHLTTPGKFWMNTSFGAYGLTPFGLPASMIYFGTEAFYPGGFPEAVRTWGEGVSNYNKLCMPYMHYRSGGGL